MAMGIIRLWQRAGRVHDQHRHRVSCRHWRGRSWRYQLYSFWWLHSSKHVRHCTWICHGKILYNIFGWINDYKKNCGSRDFMLFFRTPPRSWMLSVQYMKRWVWPDMMTLLPLNKIISSRRNMWLQWYIFLFESITKADILFELAFCKNNY